MLPVDALIAALVLVIASLASTAHANPCPGDPAARAEDPRPQEQRDQPAEIAIGRDDLAITKSVRIRRSEYHVRDLTANGVLHVRGDDITIDFQGATLIGCAAADGNRPDRFAGVGIRIQGGRKVVVKNAIIRGFKIAIQAVDCEDLRITGCDTSRNFRQHLSSTPEAEVSTDWLWPHENDAGQWQSRYGAGISLTGCRDATLDGNRGRDGQNGILLSRCTGCRVYDNDFSFNSGWGLALWRSSQNVVSHNRFDWCVRGYSHGVYDRGQDSTGILVFEHCNKNIFAYNSATHGGDGFFLYAGHETTKKTGEGGCDGNLVFRNDFSYAVANGIEATFSRHNRFVENILVGCNYGIWAGYSSETTIAGNLIKDNTIAGVAIEHGHLNRIENNTFANNRRAVQLWWDEDRQFLDSVYGKRRNTESEDYTIVGNRFRNDRVAIELRDTHRVGISNNRITETPLVLDLLGKRNTGVVLQENLITFAATGEAPVRLARNRTDVSQVIGPNRYDVAAEVVATMTEGDVQIATPLSDFEPKRGKKTESLPRVPGTFDAFRPAEASRGRQYILVDEWGPVDPRTVRLTPNRVTAANEATFYLIGPDIAYRVVRVTGDVTVTPNSGRVPQKLVVRAKDGAGARLVPFTVAVEAEGVTFVCSGSLWHMRWNTRAYPWARKPGEAAKAPPGGGDSRSQARAWKRIVAKKPIAVIEGGAIDFGWGNDGPAGGAKPAPTDFFATVSRATFDAPAGVYEVRTVSDDGIRVWLDGKLIIDDWTWHPPKRHNVTIPLTAGAHRLRVEHFEIDGFAQLAVSIKPSAPTGSRPTR